MTGFKKNENCPTSHDLLKFANGGGARRRAEQVRRHISRCEFCAAEVEFYSHYPQAEGTTEPAEIPTPLLELAEALLKKHHTDARSLNSLLKGKRAL